MNRIAIGTSCRAVACGFVALLLAGLGLFRVADVHGQEPVEASLAIPPGLDASFSLVDQHGQPVTDKDFRGSFMLVYFGYTYCPDVCPLGLQRMSAAIKALGPDGERVVPIFITLDPERDTGKVLAAYTSHFHPRLIGLAGAREQIDAAKRAYGVRGFKLFPPPSFEEEDSERGSEGDAGDNSRYLVQHTASTYLVDPDGKLASIFLHEMSSREMAGQLEVLVRGNP